MKTFLIYFALITIIATGYGQKDVTIEGSKYFVKSSETVLGNLKVFSLCQDQKLSKNCVEYFTNETGKYIKLPVTKVQFSSAVKASRFNSIKGVKKALIAANTIYYFQTQTGNTYLSSDESGNLVLYPVSSSNDVITMSRKVSQGTKTLEEKCNKACPFVLPPNCPVEINGRTSDCFLRLIEDTERCRLKCKGKIRTTSSIAAFEGIVINTKSN